MGAFGGLIQTKKGRNLQAKAELGAELVFTRMAIGDGQLSGQSIPDLNGLVSEKKSLPITRKKLLLPGQAVIGAVLSNQDVTTGFYFRELGIFARDPDDGEILYAYGNSGSGAEYIPPAGTADIIEKTIDMIVTFGQAQNVSAVINSSLVYATPDDVEAALEEAKQYTDTAVAGVKVPDATLTQKGITQLSNATDSTSEAMAATPKAVKAAMDEALASKQLGVEQKANVVAALNSIGVAASTNETWAQLIAKMAGVIRATGNATTADVLAGKTFSNGSGNGLTGSMPNRSAENNHMPGLESTVWPGDRVFIRPPNGHFNGATWVTAPAPGLTAANIRSGVNVLGLVGTLQEGKKFYKQDISIPAYGKVDFDINIGFNWSVVLLIANSEDWDGGISSFYLRHPEGYLSTGMSYNGNLTNPTLTGIHLYYSNGNNTTKGIIVYAYGR
ncbi:hypothetical protein J2TS6_42760 [Paenibacillus albilobatus]|uniref:Phage tail fibre protein N-terminal domain-containing protein n=1 Tax=Paenibacillus albilobatus TaxID=2716884 RepID=A0A919XLS5_9BACL|nr:tail fiber protein [Paenibacillus albilobatus]GIO33135.1 hypothetical protein J2TS6_42760 [Paenibacillus albilobatus]